MGLSADFAKPTSWIHYEHDCKSHRKDGLLVKVNKTFFFWGGGF